jgi:hypothetical protein
MSAGRSSIRNLRTRHAVVTGTHLSRCHAVVTGTHLSRCHAVVTGTHLSWITGLKMRQIKEFSLKGYENSDFTLEFF